MVAVSLPAQRQLDVPWRDYVTAPDVTMIAVDAKVSTLALDAGTMQVHQGTAVSDADGPRVATLLIPAGTSAVMKMPDGSTQALSSLSIRSTEFTVGDNGPQAMPGDLPAATGFTYAVEYSVDAALAAGADKVGVSQPIPTYVENFVGFPVGSQLPAGSYDRKQAKWIPEANGRVIKVLGAPGGVADVDVTGDGVADTGTTLDEIGMTTAEREKLATLYEAGTELWRVLVGHFSAWDYNYPYGPKDDPGR